MSAPTRKRGRPREFDEAEALAGATRAFIRHGYTGASLDVLASEMQLNKPSLYAAFGDKRTLHLTVLEARFRRVGLRFRAAFDEGKTLEEALRNMFEDCIEVCLGEGGPPGCPIANAATEALADDALGAATREYRARTDRGLSDWVRKKAGSDCDGADAIGRLANTVLYDIALRARVGESRTKLREIARDAARILAGGKG